MDPKQIYNFNFPTSISFGAGVSRDIGTYLKSLSVNRPLLVTDPGVHALPFFQDIRRRLDKEGFKVEVFSEIHKNPIKSDVHKGADHYRGHKADSLVAIGGGAALDVGRAIAILAYHEGDLFDFEDGVGGAERIRGPIPKFVTVPTTSGTGSEVGRSAIISDDVTKEKKILFSPRLMALKVFADPILTMELPPAVTAATGMDALTHNLEALVARGFHPMCDGIALEGIRLVGESLVQATLNPDVSARGKMMMASLMGAVAFQKGLGVVHSLAHPLSTKFDMHHGLANAMMLATGVHFNRSVAGERYRRAADALGTHDLVKYIRDLNAELSIPSTLTSQGIKESDLAALAELAFKDFCHPANPRPVSEQDFLLLYREML